MILSLKNRFIVNETAMITIWSLQFCDHNGKEMCREMALCTFLMLSERNMLPFAIPQMEQTYQRRSAAFRQ
jgi:hypothetical protein